MDEDVAGRIESVHEDLARAGMLVPVALGGADERSWVDCELASLAENRLGDLTDPEALDEARREDWLARAAERRMSSLSARSAYERGYWLLEQGERVGTLALATSTLGTGSLGFASFYVFPRCRGRGAGRRALERAQEAASRHDLGIRLSTSWCWQRAARFYVARGMWIMMWKRDLTFCSDASTPRPRIEVGAAEASLSVPIGQDSVVLARARRHGDRLELEEPSHDLAKNEEIGEAYWHATSTLSLSLALHGWPLIRSQEAWDQGYYADAGPPESLAYKITIWEAWAAKQGWAVSTPRIPGLRYPSWDELEARWDAEREELEAYLTRKA